MPNTMTVTRSLHGRIPSQAEVFEMVRPNTSMRAVLARTVAGAGLRGSELCVLSWEDADFKGGAFHIDGSKNGLGSRQVPILPLLGEVLQTWKEVAPSSSGSLVFPNPRGEPFSPERLSSWYRKGGGLYQAYPLMALRQFCLAWWSGDLTGRAHGGLSVEQMSRLLGKAPTPFEWRQFAKFASYDPIDLEWLVEAERAAFSPAVL